MQDCESKRSLQVHRLACSAPALFPLLLPCQRMITPPDVEDPFMANNAMKGSSLTGPQIMPKACKICAGTD